jgi:hypothetical protein
LLPYLEKPKEISSLGSALKEIIIYNGGTSGNNDGLIFNRNIKRKGYINENPYKNSFDESVRCTKEPKINEEGRQKDFLISKLPFKSPRTQISLTDLTTIRQRQL